MLFFRAKTWEMSGKFGSEIATADEASMRILVTSMIVLMDLRL